MIQTPPLHDLNRVKTWSGSSKIEIVVVVVTPEEIRALVPYLTQFGMLWL